MESPLLHRRYSSSLHNLRHRRLGHCVQKERSVRRLALDAGVDLCRDAVPRHEFAQVWRGGHGCLQVSRVVSAVCMALILDQIIASVVLVPVAWSAEGARACQADSGEACERNV